MPDYRSTDRRTAPFVAGAELLSANGNQPAKLFGPGAPSAAGKELDAPYRMGVTGVTVGVKFPLLLPVLLPGHTGR
jgi:hypothetical protein